MEKDPFHMHLNFMVRPIFEKKFRIFFHELKTRALVKSYVNKYLYDEPITLPSSENVAMPSSENVVNVY